MYTKDDVARHPTLRLLTGNALNRLGEVEIAALQPIRAEQGENLSRFLLRPGDVALLARGSAMRSGAITEEVAKKQVVASTNFLILRPDPERLLGEVLVFYLNSPAGQALLDTISTGAALKSAPASKVKKLAISVPDIETQKNMADLFRASNQAFNAGTQFLEAQQKLVQTQLLNMLKGAES